MKKNSSFIKIYGKHPVLAALANTKRTHKELFTTKNTYLELKEAIDKSGIKVNMKSPHEMDSLAQDSVHQNIILHTSSIMHRDMTFLNPCFKKERSLIIALDQVTDPQNVGAIIRSALAFNVDAILLPEHTAPDETPSLIKASSGAIEKLPIVKITNLVNTIQLLQKNNYWVIGLDSNTNHLMTQSTFGKKTLLILGSEGKGLRRLTKEHCDDIVKLPMAENSVESLNVSNAAAIVMYEIFKSSSIA